MKEIFTPRKTWKKSVYFPNYFFFYCHQISNWCTSKFSMVSSSQTCCDCGLRKRCVCICLPWANKLKFAGDESGFWPSSSLPVPNFWEAEDITSSTGSHSVFMCTNHGCPTFWLAWPALGKEELPWLLIHR